MKEKKMRPDSPRSILAQSFAAPDSFKWLCYYGNDRNVLALPGYSLLVLEADALGTIHAASRDKRVCLAYISIGEITPNRWYWNMVQDKPWLLEENPAWPGSRRVDPRSAEWQEMLIGQIAPALLSMGYDGLMLDNADIGEHLENSDPQKYAGAVQAVGDIIRQLREAYPEAVLVPNGALATCAENASAIDAVMNESAFSRWHDNRDGTYSYGEIPPEARAWIRPRLMRARSAGLPVLALEYVDLANVWQKQKVSEAARKANLFPYLADRSLMQLPKDSE